jgi:hypothetical protein
MARAQKSAPSAHDGMSWIALMPFPAFTPLNWWALTSPRNAMLASLNATRVAIDAWRATLDGARAVARLQMDEALRTLEAQVQNAGDAAEADTAEPAAEPEREEAAAVLMMRPMMEATRAYGRMGRAFIVAQRDTLRAFAPPADKPH